MFYINKITSDSTVDFAAEELKKYLRMMMPEAGDVKISYNPNALDGFRLGLMQDFSLSVSDANEVELDDIIYIDCDASGGIIAGDNPRSVLLAVYEYLRRNGCRWLFPGVDGEYIPMQDIAPVEARHAPSCRYRGMCNEGAEYQADMLEFIDFLPKVGMNVFMMEFFIPVYYRFYYNHLANEEARAAEPVSDTQILQWKRQCETEMAKRGLQFHDIGHGFTCDPFGIEFSWERAEGEILDERLTDEQRSVVAMMNGERKLFRDIPGWTNFCMSNEAARSTVSDYVVDYAKNHSNVDYLHVWLADVQNNHCECEACQKKTPSDWYIILLNEIDKKLEAQGLNTRIVFISYVDTTFAPLEETLNNPKRFTMLIAPIFRSYAYSMPNGRGNTEILPYVRNKNTFPPDLASSLDYFDEWRKTWRGANISYEYHFWRHQCYDLTGLMQARLINEDVRLYKENGIDGIIEDGSQRSFFPSGLSFYTYARTLFDTSLTYEEIEEDYFSHIYGENWKDFRNYLQKISDALPFEILSRDEEMKTDKAYDHPEMAEQITRIREITKEGRLLIAENRPHKFRVQTLASNLLAFHADFCDMISDWMAEKVSGRRERAEELLSRAKFEIGKREPEFEKYYDQFMYFTEYYWIQNHEKSMDYGIALF